MILGCSGAIGAIVWVERHVLGSGYRAAHAGAAVAIVVLAGCAVGEPCCQRPAGDA